MATSRQPEIRATNDSRSVLPHLANRASHRHANDTSGHSWTGLRTHLDSHANRRCPTRSTHARRRTKTRARDVSVALLMAATRHTQPKRRTHRAETPRARPQNHSGCDVPVSGLPQRSRSSWEHLEQAHLGLYAAVVKAGPGQSVIPPFGSQNRQKRTTGDDAQHERCARPDRLGRMLQMRRMPRMVDERMNE
jgi:hypothetical protein